MHLIRHAKNTSTPADQQNDEGERGFRMSDSLRAEVTRALHEWRTNMAQGSELARRFDPTRDHVRGNPAAPVVVLEYGCLGSAGESPEDHALRRKLRSKLDDDTICLAFRHFPMIDSHPGALLAAAATEAADRQGRFWDMCDALTDMYDAPTDSFPRSGAKELDWPALLALARRLNLDIGRFEADIALDSSAARIVGDLYDGIRSGVNGAPSFYVQGIRQDVDGPDELVERIESALAGDVAALWPPMHSRRRDNRVAARLWHESLGRSREAAEHWADDIVWRGWNEQLPGGGVARGKAAVAALHHRSDGVATGFRLHPHDYIEHADRVLVIGDAVGLAPGSEFRFPYVQIWKFEAGKAIRVDCLIDMLAIDHMIGEPAPTDGLQASAAS